MKGQKYLERRYCATETQFIKDKVKGLHATRVMKLDTWYLDSWVNSFFKVLL